ncbi:putative nucleotidyltransferase substrate binding domain-containing protein [Vibrio rumoiensis]|uniref:Histidine kinase n=1 Tax=Vibrio rumoiensis 1S-45 TaxID=1188252 RepID=A0A1E5DZB1_9VIBR|nr:putative nucleotidyltransferase substrate binding domain-containing protein [Vibrio rumoiensis]OEF23168.1 histidine kinase [Vibrio rumoiensis 1S-45]
MSESHSDNSLLANIVQYIATIEPFNNLPKDVISELASIVQITYVSRGEIIDPYENQNEKYLYIVRTGAMEQRKLDGQLRARLGSDDIFGFTFLDGTADEDNRYTAVALQNSLLYLIPHSSLVRLFERKPEYAEYFASQAQVRLKTAHDVVWSNKEKGLFIKRVGEVASGIIAVVTSDMTIKEVAHEMRIVKRCSCAVIYENDKIIGLITDRDMTKRVIAHGAPLSDPISTVMTPNPFVISPDALILEAASMMMEHNIRNIPVVHEGKAVGLLTTTHLVQNHRMQAIFLIEKIKYTNSVSELSLLTSERQAIFEALVEGKVASDIIGKVMSMIMDAYTRRLIQIAIDKLGTPPCEYNWISAGSHARNELNITSDQDTALILSDDATNSDKIYFRHLGSYVSNGLDRCGYPLCTGKFMAATPKWCQPLSIWKEYYKKWVANPEYECLLNISVFLEIRSIYGNAEYTNILRDELHQNILENRTFLSALVRDAVNTNPPLGIFNSLVLEKNGDQTKVLNIKKYAINLIIDLARIYGLAVECESSGTEERFKAARDAGILSENMYKNIIGAYHFIAQFRYSHQLEKLKQGEVPDNYIDPNNFGSFERQHLKDAFRIIADMQEAAKLRFGAISH